MEAKEVRQFVAFAYSAQLSLEQGKVKPIAEYVDGELVPVDPTSLSASGLIFVRYGYTEVQSKYGDGHLFRVTAEPNQQSMEDMDPALWCSYICTANNIQPLAPRELIEVIATNLKELSPNNRNILIGNRPIGTNYVLLQTLDGQLFGPFDYKQDSTESDMISVFPPDRPVGGPSLLSKHVFMLSKELASANTISFGGRSFLRNVQAFSQAEQFNFANDQEVLSFCAQLSPIAGKRLVEKSLLNNSASQLLFLKNSKNQSLTKEMLERLKSIEAVEADASKALEEGVAKFLSSNAGAVIVSAYI